MMPASTITELAIPLAPAEIRPITIPARSRSKPILEPRGTRNGWAMRTVYLLSDLAAFAISFASGKLIVDWLFGRSLAELPTVELKLYALWIIGLVGAAAAQQTYGAIPPRPVRKFRGWVQGALTVCAAVPGGAWLLGVGSTAMYAALVLASGFAVLLASFSRALCR